LLRTQIKLRRIHPSPTTPSASNPTIIPPLITPRLPALKQAPPPFHNVNHESRHTTRERICFPDQPVPARPASHHCTKQAYQDSPAAAPLKRSHHQHPRALGNGRHSRLARPHICVRTARLPASPRGWVWGKDRRWVFEVPCRDVFLRPARLHRCVNAGLQCCQGVLPRGRVWLYYITDWGGCISRALLSRRLGFVLWVRDSLVENR
jgi:hypothetical protein